eukprot:m.16069 g.16069  ORF g.16069 m.16069 type:complete len:70 (-) comp5579_c0_seq1:100-309(-)
MLKTSNLEAETIEGMSDPVQTDLHQDFHPAALTDRKHDIQNQLDNNPGVDRLINVQNITLAAEDDVIGT